MVATRSAAPSTFFTNSQQTFLKALYAASSATSALKSTTAHFPARSSKTSLLGRVNFAYRDREGAIEEIGPTEDLDGLGTENISLQLQWTPTDNSDR